jgi:DNA-binding response OmpR family regulator
MHDVVGVKKMKTRVLIADADTLLTGTYRSYLSAQQYDVRLVQDGLACVSALQEFSPQVLVLGTSLAWGGCEGVLAVLNEDARLPRPLVIILASERERAVLYRISAMHIDEFQIKPVSPARLGELLRRMLGSLNSGGPLVKESVKL